MGVLCGPLFLLQVCPVEPWLPRASRGRGLLANVMLMTELASYASIINDHYWSLQGGASYVQDKKWSLEEAKALAQNALILQDALDAVTVRSRRRDRNHFCHGFPADLTTSDITDHTSWPRFLHGVNPESK